MRNMWTIVLALATTAIANGVWGRVRDRPVAARPTDAAHAQGVADDDAAELGRLRERVAGLERLVFRTLRSGASAPAGATEGAAKTDPEPPSVEGREEALAVQQAERLERLRKLERLLASEPVDASWNREVGGSTAAFFQRREIEGLSLASLACGTSLCKMEIAAKNALSTETLIDLFGPHFASFGEVSTSASTNPDGSGAAVVYLARPGAHLDL